MRATGGRRAAFAFLSLVCLAIALAGLRYLFDGPGRSAFVVANAYALPWLKVHVAAGAVALAIGPWQFLTRAPPAGHALHRWLGRTYVGACLLGGAAGLLLASGTLQGPVAQAGFTGLALAWLVTTSAGWMQARRGRYPAHRRWMIRSFAVTFSAVTLRLYLPVAPSLGYDFDLGYRAAAWLCWVPNLILAELYLRGRPGISSSASSRS